MRDDANHPDPLDPIDPREAVPTDTSWVAPDPPPIPDRIRKKVEPRRATLPTLPKVEVNLNHRAIKLGFLGGGLILVVLVVSLLLRPSVFDDAALAEWQELCDDYARWFSPLAKSVTHEDAVVLRDLGLGSVVDTLNEAQTFDPRVIADTAGSNLAAIAQQPPATARSAEAIKATRQAAAQLARVEAAFAKWPTTAALNEHRDLLARHGWERAAELVQNTLKAAPPYGRAPVGEALIAMQRLEAQTAGIAVALEHLGDDLAVLAPLHDPVFDALIQAVDDLDHGAPDAKNPQLLDHDPAAVQLVGLAEALGPLEAFATRFRATVQSDRWAAINHEQFRETGQAYAMLAAGDEPYDKIFRAWLDEADGFRDVEDDWRPAWADAQRQALEPANAALRTLQAAEHPTAKPLANRIDQLTSRIDDLAATPLTASLTGELDVQRQTLEREVRDLVASAQRLDQEITAQQTAASLRHEAPLTDDPTLASAATEAAWQAQRQRIADRLENTGDLDAAAGQLDTARQQLLTLTDPASALGLPAPLSFVRSDHRAKTAALLAVLQQRTADQREATLGLALKNGLPVDETRWAKLHNNYVQRLAQAQELADLAQRIDRAIAGAYPLDDPAITTADGGLRGEVASWKQSSLMNDPAVAEAAAAVWVQVESLGELAAVDSWETLSESAMETRDPAAGFAAWRRMGAVAWPGDARALDTEVALQDHLATLAQTVGLRDPARGETLDAELIAARPERWQLAMRSAAAGGDASADDLRKIAGLADAMGVQDDTLPADVRFNLLLARAQSALASLPTEPGPGRDAEILAMTKGFAQQVRPMAGRTMVGGLLATLNGLTAQGPTERELLAEAGPARRGWAVQPRDDGQAVRFTRRGWALDFVRVDPERGPPFYLCTTELPVGLALDVVGWDRRQDDFLAVMPTRGDRDTRKGPRSWAYGESSFVINPHNWLGDSPVYPGYLRDLTPSPPTAGDPLNYVSAEGASLLAAMLGCRLPTAEQWVAAADRYPVPPRTVPNLRDTTWARHAMHTAQLIKSGVPQIDWANSDVFRPSPQGPDAAAVADDPVGDFHPINDATLWFVAGPTPGDEPEQVGSPVHLIGNVAELVTTGPVDPDTLLDPATPMAERRETFRQAHKADFAVLGGSALSPASLNPAAPSPFNVFSGAGGYADVGVRLAFEVPFVSPARQAERVLRDQPFLQP